jgi:putative membrane protein
MKTLKYLLMVIAACWSLQACNSNTKKADSVESATDTTEKTANVEDDVAEFMTEAASGGMMEVELGKTAEKSAGNQDVKSFGALMVKDHTKANAELKALAALKNITLPQVIGKEHQEKVNDLIKLKGAEFDKKYISMMVDDHKEDIKHFEKASKFKDADISAFAKKTLPTLTIHLQSAEALDKQMKK